MKKCKARAPGKLILSGEHAVVYGSPAISLAIDRYATTVVSARSKRSILFELPNLAHHKAFTKDALHGIKRRLKSAYKKFTYGDLDFNKVLESPFDLAHFVFINTLDKVKLQFSGLNIKTESELATGCGMGSSAAMALSMTAAIAGYYDIQLTPEQYYELGQEAEKLQHGYPSGLDVRTILEGGCVFFESGAVSHQAIPEFEFHLVNTGSPIVSTGESVTQVKRNFESSEIWNEFSDVTETIKTAVTTNDLKKLADCVTINQRLLETIGVVPDKVKRCILTLEETGAAAKVCGAGAVKGDAAGVVLVLTDDEAVLAAICQEYDYDLTTVKVAIDGLQVI